MDTIHIDDNASARSMSSSSDSMNMSRHSNNINNSINIVTINDDNNKNINNKKNLPIENLTSNDVICCLWNKNALEKCRIGLADVLIYEGGKPTRWYVTGKTGEVTKKRSIDLTLITQRWLKIREQYNSPMVAIIKQEGGIMKFLNIEAFERFLQDNISSSSTTNSNHNANQNVSSSNIDLTISSIHCFIHGDNHIVYRNKYQLRDIKGRVNTSTLTYSLNLSSNTTTESVVTMYEHSLIFHESKAMQIKSILDLATTTVVRYVETMLSIKLLEITIDYIIDKNSQIWMLWCLNTQFVRSTRLEDLNLPIPNIDKDGRISWMGRKYLEELDESKRREVVSPPSLQQHSYRLSTPSNNNNNNNNNNNTNIYNSRGGMQVVNTFGAELIKPSIYSTYPKPDDHEISPHIAALQVNEAANVTVSDAFAPKSSLQRKRVNENHSASYQLSTINDNINPKGPLLSSAPSLSRSLLLSPPSSPQLQQLPSSTLSTSTTTAVVNKLSNASLTALSLSLGSYPNAFKCKGDYCNFLIDSKHASISNTAIEHLTKKLFTESEILRLRKDKNFNKMMEFESTGPALAIMTMRSIVLARQERRGLIAPDVNDLNNQPWNKYPESPRNKINFPSSSLLSSSTSISSTNSIDGDNNGIDSKEQKIIENILIQDKDQRESFTKSMSTYYDQIRVCGVCFSIYTCLDWARDILGKGDAYGAGLNGVGAAYPKLSKLQPRIRTNDNILLLKGKGDDSSTIESSAIAVDNSNIRFSKTTSSLIPSYASATTASIASQIPRKDQQQQQQQSHQLSSTLPTSSNQSSSPIRQSSSNQSSSSYSHLPSVTSTLIGRDDESISTWKSYISQAKREEKKVEGNKFVQLDDYLRGGNAQLADRKEKEKVKQQQQQQQMKIQTATNDHTSLSSSSTSSTTLKSNNSYNTNVYHGKVLLACELNDYSRDAKMILEEAYYDVTHAYEGRQAVNNHILLKDGYDCILVQRDLPLINAIELTKEIRKDELIKRKEAAAYAASQGKGVQPYTRRHPVICYTSKTTPEDLKVYMNSDMDGCVSYPVNKLSLLNTIRAAIPQHLASLSNNANIELSEEENLASISAQKNQPKVYKLGGLGQMEGSTDSSSMAAKTLPIAQRVEDDIAFNGIVQIDADTRVPFIVMDASRTSKVYIKNSSKKTFFNLVIVHDIFDTAERMKIFFTSIVSKYLGMQILLWNYPGQAFTEYRDEQLLNNEYHATCLNEVLGQIGEKGTKDFDTSHPFYILGYGYGANIAAFYTSHYRIPNLRGFININGYSFIDSYLAGIMHDCINIFQCAPPSRPDLPVYFFSRFLFSKDYLSKVSVPLALNIYTAIHNSISNKGRINLCKGVLQSIDIRVLLNEIDCPIICIHSTQDSLARPLHTDPFIHKRNGEVRSIYKVLHEATKTCVIWMKGGHEIFQENKKQLQLMLEQILTGFHETHDISFPTAAMVDPIGAAQGKIISSLPWENNKINDNNNNIEKTVEDKFIDSVLNSVNRVAKNSNNFNSSGSIAKSDQSSYNFGSLASYASSVNNSTTNNNKFSLNSPTHSVVTFDSDNDSQQSSYQNNNNINNNRTAGVYSKNSIQFAGNDNNSWNTYATSITDSQNLSYNDNYSNDNYSSRRGKRRNGKNDDSNNRVLDPNSALFERQDNPVYGKTAMEIKKQQQQDVHDFPEVKEYMGWRLKRNKKRLQRLQSAARSIQGAFRTFIAKRLVKKLRRRKAALLIQRTFRGWLGRCKFKDRVRKIWGAQVIQRGYRGYKARKWYYQYRLQIAASCNIQRIYRGYKGRKRVKLIHKLRYYSSSLIQAMYRRYAARKLIFRMRKFRNCSTSIQRIFRGFLGRKKALAERDKYIFSRSQSHGIEFGRQMLLEHKLHATRLQSDVTLLTQEKVGAEEQIEALLEEISSFEEGVRILEKEMHQLSKVESEASAFMDEDSRFELREQKMKLDHEFGDMLSKISNRKDMLDGLEKKLSIIDKTRQTKEEELRTLERKLVVLLEEQQNELNAIKKKQDIRGQMLASSHNELMKATVGGGINSNNNNNNSHGGGGGGGGGSGPSLQEKKQAAQLMQSTETLMKFGFMSMSMTYFSSMNMVKALRTVSAQDTVMAALSDVHAQRAVGYVDQSSSSSSSSLKKAIFEPDAKRGQLSGQQLLRVSSWSVEDVSKWLQTLSLGQYSEAFIDAAVDGEFLYDLNDDDLKNTLGIEHRLHRKKILNCVHRLKIAEVQKDSKLNELLRSTGGMDAPVRWRGRYIFIVVDITVRSFYSTCMLL